MTEVTTISRISMTVKIRIGSPEGHERVDGVHKAAGRAALPRRGHGCDGSVGWTGAVGGGVSRARPLATDWKQRFAHSLPPLSTRPQPVRGDQFHAFHTTCGVHLQ